MQHSLHGASRTIINLFNGLGMLYNHFLSNLETKGLASQQLFNSSFTHEEWSFRRRTAVLSSDLPTYPLGISQGLVIDKSHWGKLPDVATGVRPPLFPLYISGLVKVSRIKCCNCPAFPAARLSRGWRCVYSRRCTVLRWM